MRALYFPDLNSKIKSYNIEKRSSSFHHLSNVLRIRTNDQLLLLNGSGDSVLAQVIVSKCITLNLLGEVIKNKRNKLIHLYIGLTKPDSFKRVIQNSTECGVASINPVISEFSQRYKINYEKLHKISISSLEQSNNYHLPVLNEAINISNLKEDSNHSYILDCAVEKKPSIVNNGETNIFIGPEGGWSVKDIDIIENKYETSYLKLNLPILRSYNAVVASIGYLN